MPAILAPLGFAFAMSWEILWALILGFGLSAAVQAVASKSETSRLLRADSPCSLGIAGGCAVSDHSGSSVRLTTHSSRLKTSSAFA